MSGFDNDVLYADNVDFTGTSPVSGQINQDGELLVGSSVAPNIRSYVPAGSNGVSITTGQGTIDFSLSNVPNSALANSTITVSGGTGISIIGSPVSLGGAVSISATSTDISTITGNSGGALSPTAGNLNIVGSGSTTTSGSGSTLTVQLTGLTNHALLVGAGTTTITKVGPSATTGQVLQSAGASADPAFSTATFPSTATGTGKILIADGTNWVASTPTFPNASASSGKFIRSDGTNWVASTPTLPTTAGASGKLLQSDATNYVETTATYPGVATGTGTILRADGTNWVASTPTYPNAASTAGKVVVSDGTNLVMSTPTFPNSSATSGKVIKSDGTNWVASTETYAAPSTSGNVMTSDGTNWTSAAAPGGGTLKTSTITLTSAQIKALRGTPITVISAAGSGVLINPTFAVLKFNYGGTNAFTNGQALKLKYTNGTGLAVGTVVVTPANLQGTASVYLCQLGVGGGGNLTTAIASMENQLLCIHNDGASEITGNAAGNNTITLVIQYFLSSI